MIAMSSNGILHFTLLFESFMVLLFRTNILERVRYDTSLSAIALDLSYDDLVADSLFCSSMLVTVIQKEYRFYLVKVKGYGI